MAAAASTARDRDNDSDGECCCCSEEHDHGSVLDSYFRDHGWDPANESKEDFLMNQWISAALKASASCYTGGDDTSSKDSGNLLNQDDADSSSASENIKPSSPTSCIKLLWQEDEGGNELGPPAAPPSFLLRTSPLLGQALDSIPEADDESCASSSTAGASCEFKLKYQLEDDQKDSSIGMREADFKDVSLDDGNETMNTFGNDDVKEDDPAETISLDWLLQTKSSSADRVKKDESYSLVSDQKEETTRNTNVNRENIDDIHGNSTSVSTLISRMQQQEKREAVTENVTDQTSRRNSELLEAPAPCTDQNYLDEKFAVRDVMGTEENASSLTNNSTSSRTTESRYCQVMKDFSRTQARFRLALKELRERSLVHKHETHGHRSPLGARRKWLFVPSACFCLGLLLVFLFATTNQQAPAVVSDSLEHVTTSSIIEFLELRHRIIDYYIF